MREIRNNVFFVLVSRDAEALRSARNKLPWTRSAPQAQGRQKTALDRWVFWNQWAAMLGVFDAEKSDREIARLADCSPTLVGKIRRMLERDWLSVVEKWLGYDGKRRKKPEFSLIGFGDAHNGRSPLLYRQT
jgi:hypothetical protein